MPQPPRRHTPARYQLRVDGHLDTHWSARFDDLALRSEDDGTTTMTGLVQDQSQLHGLLAKIRDLGLALISIRVLDETQIDTNAEDKGW
jgi:hypothetical protein